MTAREDPTVAAEAQTKALAAIAALKEQRLAEGHTEAELTMTHALAEVVVGELLANAPTAGADAKGRVILLMDEFTSPAVERWVSMRKPRTTVTVEGGIHHGKEFG